MESARRDRGATWASSRAALATAVAAVASRAKDAPSGVQESFVFAMLAAAFAVEFAHWAWESFSRVFTRADSLLLSQGVASCVADAAAAAIGGRGPASWRRWLPPHLGGEPRAFVTACVLSAVAGVCVVPGLRGSDVRDDDDDEDDDDDARRKNAHETRFKRRARGDDAAIVRAAAVAALAPWLVLALAGAFGGEDPLIWVTSFAWNARGARPLAAYWLAALCVALPLCERLASSRALPVLFLRKAYHVLVVFMFAPSMAPRFVARRTPGAENDRPECAAFLAVAFAGATLAFAAAEVARATRVTAFGVDVGGILDRHARRFLDARDSGGGNGIVMSHFSLLLGCAVPLWLTREAWRGRADGDAGSGVAPDAFALSPFAGIITLGLGDTVASVVGTMAGRTRICRGCRKTVEGTMAGALANALGAAAAWRWAAGGGAAAPRGRILVASAGAAALEATTEQLDNAFLPLHFLTLSQLAAAGGW